MYGEVDERRAEAAWKRAAVVAYVLGAATIIITVLGLIVRIKWLSIAAAALGGGAVFGWISLKLAPWSAYRRFLRDMREGLERRTEGTLVSISAPTRLVDGVSVHDVLLDAGEGTDLLFYWDDDKPLPDIRPGCRVRVTSFGKFVTDCETLMEPEGG